jgi:predicted dinucleotide-binding enzyme
VRVIDATSQEEAVRNADVVIFALPDTVVGSLAKEIVPEFTSRA